jgi:hypothetical protein
MAEDKKVKKVKKSKKSIPTAGYGPEVSSHDLEALIGSTKIEISRLTEDKGQIKATKSQETGEDSPWKGTAALFRDIEVGWKGDAGSFSGRNGLVQQSIWRTVRELDKLSVGVENGLVVLRVLKSSGRTERAYIIGRSEKK